MSKKILILAGTRPEVIKLAPVRSCLSGQSSDFATVWCSTGQHRSMMDQAMNVFGIRPDVELNVMSPNQTLAGLTSALLNAIDAVLAEIRPDVILVQGDTTTAMIGALAGFYQGIAVGHVEAGLRTGDLRAPFPEEANRTIISRLAAWHFAPTERSKRNLLAEGVPENRIEVTGNTVLDAMHWIKSRSQLHAGGEVPPNVIESLKHNRLLLVTGHRRESFGEGLASICRSLLALADKFEDVVIIYPVHLNPNVQEPVRQLLHDHPRIHLLPPVSYPTMLWLMQQACLVLSDSGGVQEEAPSFSKPLLILRETTERPEVVEAGCAVLVGTDEARITAHAERLLEDADAYQSMVEKPSPFGDGHAAERIVAKLAGGD